MKYSLLRRLAAGSMAALVAMGIATPVGAVEEEKVPLTRYYSSEEFEAEFTYNGSDLGATYSKEQTVLRVWAPTAQDMKVRLYAYGHPDQQAEPSEELAMTPDVNGTWVLTLEGDRHGTYYTYLVNVDGMTNEACDPYARTTGANGLRAMIIDLERTDPEGWEQDVDPHFGNNITDAVIYELHVRDLSVDESSGITNKGKYLGLIETGTTNANGIPTGLDHIKNLGVTHIHLLPSYDYGSVDETRLEEPQFNWGYDPVNYNVPEGSYATDPFNGEVRVREFKQMVKDLHDNGISVIMDVVYNHVFDAESFCFNQIVPQYFSRVNEKGQYSQGSGCKNDTASERSMVKKYIVESVKYWADEYHIDGFRFDLVGLIDTQTINAVMEEVHKTHPNVIFYGEGWTMNTEMTKDGYEMCTQPNSTKVPGFAMFNDNLRDALRGPMGNSRQPGFISGAAGYAGSVDDSVFGAASWCKTPTQTINYASCHDNLALFDRIVMSTKDRTFEEQVRMNNLAAAVVMLSQGVPFFQAGEEMLRSKPLEDGSFDHNSYRSPDSVNNLKWDTLNDATYQQVRDYYTGLIAFRKAHPALRMTSAEDVSANMTQLRKDVPSGMLAFQIGPKANGEDNYGIFMIFNSRSSATEMQLPEGEWTVYVQGDQAGTTALDKVQGSVTVEGISTTVLVLEQEPEQIPDQNEQVTKPSEQDGQPASHTRVEKGQNKGWLLLGFCVGLGVVAGATVLTLLLKRKKK